MPIDIDVKLSWSLKITFCIQFLLQGHGNSNNRGTKVDCPRRTSEQMMMMVVMMKMVMMMRPVSITLRTLPPSTSGGPSLDREPEHGAGRQQEALPDERRDRPPLHLDEDDLRGAFFVFCLLSSHQFNQLSKLSPRDATLASEAIQVSLRRCPTSTSPHQQPSHDVGWCTWRQPSWAGGL